jgi:hypothetical protein
MRWEAISAVADLVAAIAVLVTLVYIAIQVRQAKDQINLSGQRHRADAAREVLSSISDSPYLAPIFEKLGGWSWPDFGLDNEEDTIRWTCWCHAWMRTEEMSFRMNSPTQRETQEQLLLAWLSTSWGAKFWKENKAIYDSDFASKMNELEETVRRSAPSTADLLAVRTK